MDLDRIDRGKTAVLFYDLQNGYCHQVDEATSVRMKPMIDNAVRIAMAAREIGMPIFFAKGDNRSDGSTVAMLLVDTNMRLRPWPGGTPVRGKPVVVSGDWSSEIIAELEPLPNHYYIPKHRWSAFYQTYLDLALRARGVDTLIISGNSTDIGVAATVFAGRDLDYNLIVVKDACATAHDQRAHDALMDFIFPRMCRIRTTDEVLNMISSKG